VKPVELTPEAIGDLQEIFSQLAEMPGMGHRREDLTKQNVLFWPVHSYLVIYRDSTPLLIVAVLHGKRNIKKLLKQR